jgi:hypothetical protein
MVMKFSHIEGTCIHCEQKRDCVLINGIFTVCYECINQGVDIDLLKYKKEHVITKESQRIIHEIELTEKIGFIIEKENVNILELNKKLGFDIIEVIKSAHHITLDMISDIFFELNHELLIVVIDNQLETSTGQII